MNYAKIVSDTYENEQQLRSSVAKPEWDDDRAITVVIDGEEYNYTDVELKKDDMMYFKMALVERYYEGRNS